MNYVVAHLLRHLNEEEAFWVLCSIIENILPIDYYSLMVGTLVDQNLFRKILKKVMTRLSNHLKNLEIDISMVVIQWFISLYSLNFQPEITNEIWDNFLINGSSVLFKAGLGILSLLEKDLLKCTNFCKFYLH